MIADIAGHTKHTYKTIRVMMMLYTMYHLGDAANATNGTTTQYTTSADNIVITHAITPNTDNPHIYGDTHGGNNNATNDID